MLKKFLIIAIVFTSTMSSFSQHSVNDYKYVIVPNSYDFLDEDDQFQLNSISHFLFNKYGFTALKEDDIFPEDLMFNPCLALKSDMIDDSGAFKTKLKVQLKNCKGDIVYLSEDGESFEKKYAIAYNKALRDAFLYVKALNYTYVPNETILAMGTAKNDTSKQEIEQLKEELAALKEAKSTEVITDVAIAETVVEVTDTITETKETLLFAQKTEGGYQLVDKSSKVVMVLLNTRNPEVFMVQGKNAMVFKEDGSWFLSENNGTEVTSSKLNIKL
ncbi:hypothetical protein [Xanthomarina sp. F2636L]|uniref:hypothetical protein n=1 Tax=Xanthomarina sp. F2636L TaxID=2996018 RepID=UPI00225E2EF0|nr:hypothetical protein [Xanthomarina sp. F2636L]MCX7550725.1 hypothetical protein [Xanthomarina sp. F2636L]